MTTAIWNEGGKVRYDLLGKAMQSAGIDSGMTRSPTVASGYGGQWNEKHLTTAISLQKVYWPIVWAMTHQCIRFICAVMAHCQ